MTDILMHLRCIPLSNAADAKAGPAIDEILQKALIGGV